MKILILDDEKIYFHYIRKKFKNYYVEHEINPVAWLDKVHIEKVNLNEYIYIFCDYNFDNISSDCFELKLSKYIREHGFINYLILFSNTPFYESDKIKDTEYFDLVIDKMSNISNSEIETMCRNSGFREVWEKRLNSHLGANL